MKFFFKVLKVIFKRTSQIPASFQLPNETLVFFFCASRQQRQKFVLLPKRSVKFAKNAYFFFCSEKCQYKKGSKRHFVFFCLVHAKEVVGFQPRQSLQKRFCSTKLKV